MCNRFFSLKTVLMLADQLVSSFSRSLLIDALLDRVAHTLSRGSKTYSA